MQYFSIAAMALLYAILPTKSKDQITKICKTLKHDGPEPGRIQDIIGEVKMAPISVLG